jgi:predicted enzyme related to lactoylglutathione lyase
MMDGLLKSLVDVSYQVSDWQRAKKFYAETLGLPVAAFMGDEVGWMEFGEKDNTHLAIMFSREGAPMRSSQGGGIAVFAVDDCERAIAELRKRGVRCDDPVPVPGMITWANFYDPDGNVLQVAGPPPKG